MRLIVEFPRLVLPLSLWDTNPRGNNRKHMVEIEIVHDDMAIFAWDGRTYAFTCAFRARFEQAFIPRVETNLHGIPKDMRDFAVAAPHQNLNRSSM